MTLCRFVCLFVCLLVRLQEWALPVCCSITTDIIDDPMFVHSDQVGRLANLVHLYLNGNFITTLPEEVCRLPALTEICLDANLLEQARSAGQRCGAGFKKHPGR